MGKCSSVIREVRFVIDDEITHCYVHVDAQGDCPLGVQGWHYKAFGASVSADQILTEKHFGDHLLWPLSAPSERAAGAKETR